MRYCNVKVRSEEKYIQVPITSHEKLHIANTAIEKWQNILNIAASVFNVPAALIMLIEENEIKVFLSSKTEDNPYTAGESTPLLSGLYCETVIGTNSCLIVPNALNNDLWKNNLDVKLNMISYLGFPISWPDNELFGTICVLDNKENSYNENYIDLLATFRDSIEKDLQIMLKNKMLKEELKNRKIAEEKLRESEERYKQLFDNMQNGVIVYEAKNNGNDFHIFDLNKSAQLIENVKKSDVIGKNVLDCFHSPSIINLVRVLKEVWKTDVPRHLGPVFYKDNEREGWRESYHTYKLSSDFVVVIYDDVTEKIDFKQTIKKQDILINETLEYERIRSEFFANISHELKTPLNLIYSTIQLLDLKYKGSDEYNKSVRNFVNIMKQNCFRLMRLIDNIIDLTKIDTDCFHISFQNIDIISFIKNIVYSTRDYILDKNRELIFNSEIDEKFIYIDPDKFEKVMLNLISNSIKFTNPGDKIIINIYNKNNNTYISVKDTGIGMSDDELNIVFDRFRQADKSLTRNHEGSGIGLSITKSLVEKQNGKIYVKSNYGEYSEFIIELPDNIIEDEESKYSTKYNANPIERVLIEFSDIYS